MVAEETGYSVSNRCPHTDYFITPDNKNLIETLTIVDRMYLNKVKGNEKGIN